MPLCWNKPQLWARHLTCYLFNSPNNAKKKKLLSPRYTANEKTGLGRYQIDSKGKRNCLNPWKMLLLFNCSVISNSLQPHGLQHDSFPCPSPSPRVCSNSCPFSWWCHPTILPSAVPFFSCFQSFWESGSFLMSWLFALGGKSIGGSASAAVLPMNFQGLFPLELTGLISLLSKGLSRVFSSITV